MLFSPLIFLIAAVVGQTLANPIGSSLERKSNDLQKRCPRGKVRLAPRAALHPMTSTLTIFQTYCGDEATCIGRDNCSVCAPTGRTCSGGITQIVCGTYSLRTSTPSSIPLCCFQRLVLKYDLGPASGVSRA